MKRRLAPGIERLETRRLLTGYQIEPDSFDGIDLVPGGPGVVTLLDGTDDGFAPIDLTNIHPTRDFNFRFYGQTFTQLFVSANGLITFGSGNTSSANTDLTAAPPQDAAAILWDDWDTSVGTGSSVLFMLDDVREELIIEWNNVTHVEVGGNNGVTFHATLDLNEAGGSSSNDKIEVHYKDLLVGNATYDNGASATVGVKKAGAQGSDRLLVAFDGTGPFRHLVTSNSAFEIESKSSTITSEFGFLTSPHTLTMVFPQSVSGVDATDLVVTPVGGGTSFSPASVMVNGSTATFTFAGTIPDGRYTGTIAAGAINVGGTPTTEPITTTEFFFLLGDADRNGLVNLADFNRLAQNFGQSGRDFTQGDFNYDGTVNLADFNILAIRFGTSVAPPASTPASTTANVTKGTPGRGSPFGDRAIGGVGLGSGDNGPRGVLA